MARLRFSLFVAWCLALAPIAQAQDWTITTADLHSQNGSIKAIHSDGIELAAAAGAAPVTLPLDQFVSASRDTVATADRFVLELRDGERLSGRPRAVQGEKLAWTNQVLGDVDVPLSRVRGMVSTTAAGGGPSTETAPKQDIVNLRNGDRVSGVFTACSSSSVTIQADAGPVDVPLAAISRMTLAAAGSGGGSAATSTPVHEFLLGLNDGSRLNVSDVTLGSDQFSFTFAGRDCRVPVAMVQRIEQLNGPVSWLSSRRPVEEVAQPYFGTPAIGWPARFDSAVDGGPLMAGGKRFDRGIGVHAYSRLTFAIEPGWAAFRTQYAIDRGPEQENRLADVTVRVLLDGAVMYERQHVRSGGLSDVVTVPLRGTGRLTLECDYGAGGDVQDRLNWIQPALMRQLPAATQP